MDGQKEILDITTLPKHIRTAFEEIAVMYANAELWKKERDAFAEALEKLKDPQAVYTNILRGSIALRREDAIAYVGGSAWHPISESSEKEGWREIGSLPGDAK